jgi:hypothetical protein
LSKTSLMRVEFKYENKAVPTASLAGTEASAMSPDDATLISRDHRRRLAAARHRHHQPTKTSISRESPKQLISTTAQIKPGTACNRQVPVKLIQLMHYHISCICLQLKDMEACEKILIVHSEF